MSRRGLKRGPAGPQPGPQTSQHLDDHPALGSPQFHGGGAWPGEIRPPLRHVLWGGVSGLSPGGGSIG